MNTASTPSERLTHSRERLRLALNGLLPAPDDPEAEQQKARAAAPWWRPARRTGYGRMPV